MSTRKKAIFAGILIPICLILAGVSAAAERAVIVGYHQEPGLQEESDIRREGGKVRRSFRHVRAMAAKMSDQAVTKLRKDPRIAYIEEDAIIGAVVPVAMSIEYTNAWGVGRINAETAYNNGITGAGVKVAVLDTGIAYTNPELSTQYAGGYDFVNDDDDPFDDSFNSHGTHVAGIIAAAHDGAGAVGVAPGISLYAVKVLDGAMAGLLSDLIAGIDWAVTNGMQVVNMSVETPTDFQSLRDACDAAYQSGLILVAAAGNSNGGAVWYPAAYPSVIAVSATDQNDLVASFSAVGPEVEIAAPGVGIYSTVRPNPACVPGDPRCCDTYCTLSGTSQAAPHVTGVAALVISSGFNLDLNADGVSDYRDVRLQLLASALDLGVAGLDAIYGYGLVQAATASPPPQPAVTHLVVTKSKNKPWLDAKAVVLSDTAFEIRIENNSLSQMTVAVYKGTRLIRSLSTVIRFSRGCSDNERTLTIDATGTSYKVVFIPGGKTGTFADVYVQQAP